MKKFVLGTTLTVLTLIGGIYHLQKKSHTDHVEIPYIKAIYSKPVSYDPAQMNDGASLIFSELIYEGLLRFDESYGIQAGIAESWETSEDGKLITFRLNPKAKFHSDEKITSNDVVTSLRRMLAPESKVYKYYDMISEIKAVNEGTVEVELKSPFPPILYVLAGGTAKILPASELSKKDFFENPIGSGPFKVIGQTETDIILERFESYHGHSPKLKNITLRAIDQSLAMKEAKNGKMHDLSSWPLSGMEDVFASGQDISTVVADTWIIGFNSRIPPLNDLEIRSALKASIDNEKFRKTFYPSAAPAYGYVPQGFPGHVQKPESIETTIEIPRHSQITITIPQGLDKTDEIAKFFEDDLRAKGWNIKTEVLSWSEMMKRYEEKTLQAFLVSMIVDYPDTEFLLNNFASSNPDNYSGIKDTIIDSLISEARNLKDRIKRYKVYEKLAYRVNSLALSANLFHSRPHYWVHNCVRNFKPNLLAVAYIDYRKVEFDSECLEGTQAGGQR